jgi:VanZ family protein
MIKKSDKTINILLIIWIIAIFILSVIPMNQNTKIEIGGTPFRLDYFEHFGVFFILGLLYVLSSMMFLPKRWNEIAILIVYAIVTETIQLTIPGRTFNPWDLAYNILGFIVGCVLTNQLNKYRIKERYVR